MIDASVDLPALSKEILLNPKEAGKNPVVALLELEQPDLGFLCPLARAIYLLESKRPQRVDAIEALDSCFLIDDSMSGNCLELSDESACVEEQVSHAIKQEFNQKEIALGFMSVGDMYFYQGFWDDYLRSAQGTAWPIGLLDEPAKFNENAFAILDSDAATGPSAYPTDRGEFIGMLAYALASINDLAIEGPTLQDSKIEIDWENLSEQYTQRFPKKASCGHKGQLCWLHYLDADQAATLGIAASGEDAIGDNPDYPAWVPKGIGEEELEATWISPNDILESYSRGELSIPASTEAWFALGCGSDWYPGANLIEEDDSEDEASNSVGFKPMNRPLITVNVRRGQATLPSELLILKPYLIQLVQLLEAEES